MINDIRFMNNFRILLVKYVDDIILSIYRIINYDCVFEEVDFIKKWVIENKMFINLIKIKELVVRGRFKVFILIFLFGIEQVDNIKLLGVIFYYSFNNWDFYFDILLSKVGKRMYILRICKKFGYSWENFYYFFNILIMLFFKYVFFVWGCVSYFIYLVNIDKL